MITLRDWVAVIPPEDKLVAYAGEHATSKRYFFLPDLNYKDYDFYLDLAFDMSTVTSQAPPKQIVNTNQTVSEEFDGEGGLVTSTDRTQRESYTQTETVVDYDEDTDIVPLAKVVEADGIRLTWIVMAHHTQLPGLLRATLRAVKRTGDVKKSAVMFFTVAPAVRATPATPISKTEYEQMEMAMAEALEQSAAATYAAFEEKMDEAIGSLEEVSTLVKERTAPATPDVYGTIRAENDVITAGMFGGIRMREDGLLETVAASELDIDFRWNPYTPIVPANLDYAVRSAGDGYFALKSDVESVSKTVKTVEANATAYTDKKTAPATRDVYGTVRASTEEDEARINGAILRRGDGVLTIVAANEAAIDGRGNPCAPIVPANLEYAVKSVGDGYYAKVGEASADISGCEVLENKVDVVDEWDDDLDDKYPSVKAVVDYVGGRFQNYIPPSVEIPTADSETYGTVKVADNKGMASFWGGIYIDGNGALTIAPASEGAIDEKINTYNPIVPANLEYAVKSVGDGYYAKVGQAGGGCAPKTYEEIATFTVTADENGTLPQHVVFTLDSQGDSFRLSDFMVKVYGGFVDGNKSSLYMAVNNQLVIANGEIGSIDSSLRGFNIYFRVDNDGFKRAEYTSSLASEQLFNAQANVQGTRIVPPMIDYANPPITKIDLYIGTGTTKAWVEGSTFTLYGVRTHDE